MMSNQEVPQGYKQTKVGVIPEDWDAVRLKDILKVSQGLQIAISNRFIEPAKDRVFYITLPYVEGKKVEYIENPKQSVLCTKEDLLVVRTGSGVGKIVTDVEGAFHNNFFKIKGFDNLNINFIYHFLTTSRTRYLMKTYASNGTIPDLPHGDFYSLNCILPTLKEQQKIAQILTTWDDAISKQETLIKAKEELKKGLMQKLLSGEVRFGEFGEGTSVPSESKAKSGVGTLVPSSSIKKNGTEVLAPSGWEEVRLGEIGKVIRGVSYKPEDLSSIDNDKTVRLMRSNNIKFGYLDIREELKYVDVSRVKDNQKLKHDDLAICMANGSKNLVGKNGQYNIEDNFTYTIGAFCALFRCSKDTIGDYVKYLFQTEKYNYFIQNLLAGSNINNLKGSDIESMKFLIPNSKKEQQIIAEVLTLADKEIDLLENELEALKEQKRGLMQRLLSGGVRVKV